MSNFILLLISCMTLSIVYSFDKFNLDPYAVDRQTCTQDSECTSSNSNIVKVCLGGYCFRRCQSDNNCQSDPEYVCITYQGIGKNGKDESICKPADCQPCINRPYPPYPTNIPTQAEDDDDEEFDYEAYTMTRQTCTTKSDCTGNNPNAIHDCLGGYCFKECSSNSQCRDDPDFVCIDYPSLGKGLCKPEGCQPCINNPYPTNIAADDEDEKDDKEFDYEAYTMTRQTCSTKSDCTGNNPNAVHDCLGGYCFKECSSNNQCRDDPDFICIDYPSLGKGLCKPEGCQPCINNPYPTDTPDDDEIEDEEDTEFDYEAYTMTRQTCSTKSDCTGNNPNAVHDCLGGYCFKECSSNKQCRDDPDFICIDYPSLGKGLCKPEGCQPCINNPYPTGMGELKDALFVADMDNGDGLWSLTSEWENQSLIRLGILMVVGVFIILGLYKLKNGSKGKEKKVSINESPASAVGISSV